MVARNAQRLVCRKANVCVVLPVLGCKLHRIHLNTCMQPGIGADFGHNGRDSFATFRNYCKTVELAQ